MAETQVPGTPPGQRKRLAPARFTEQFVLMEEGDQSDIIKAVAGMRGISYAAVIREALRFGGLGAVLASVDGDEIRSLIEDERIKREGETS